MKAVSTTFILALTLQFASGYIVKGGSPFVKGEPFPEPSYDYQTFYLIKLTGDIYTESLSLVSKTKNIVIQDCNFSVIEDGALCPVPVEEMVINKSQLPPNISGKVFGNCPTLRKLYMTEIRNTSLADDFFSGLGNLKELIFYGLKIDIPISRQLFRPLVQLNDLYVILSNVTTIQPGALDTLEKLVYLELRGVRIKTIDGVLTRLTKLQHLEIRGNGLATFPWEDLKDLKELTEIDLDDNRIQHVDIEKIVSYLPNLRSFSLQRNALSCDELSKVYANIKVKKSNIETPYFWCWNAV